MTKTMDYKNLRDAEEHGLVISNGSRLGNWPVLGGYKVKESQVSDRVRVMAKRGTPATKVFLSAKGREHKCPKCGHINHSENLIKLCGNCSTKWWETKSGNFLYDINPSHINQ